MDIKLKEFAAETMWRGRFTVVIEDIVVTGRIINYIKKQEGNNFTYGLRMKFDNPFINKHPKYKEIRKSICTQISMDCKKADLLHPLILAAKASFMISVEY